LGLFGTPSSFVLGILYTFVAINVALFLFNMIPLGPLDGFSVLLGIVGEDLAMKLMPLRTYGSFLLMGLLFVGYFSPNFNFFSRVMSPLMNGIIGLLLGV
jgi:Zn-dependent protease